jgi:ABC-type branched-subunit amino acid transport system ATPase component
MMLDVQDIHGYYGKSHVLQGVSLPLATENWSRYWAATAPANRQP